MLKRRLALILLDAATAMLGECAKALRRSKPKKRASKPGIPEPTWYPEVEDRGGRVDR